MKHVPGLDGLRGLAVLGVLLFHHEALLRGGFLGVDLFFVLSGYLITQLLLAEFQGAGRIDLRAFWVRRFRRLMPAVLVLVPVVTVLVSLRGNALTRSMLRGEALGTLLYTANWHAVFERRSYWELFAAPSPLEHTWSLSIEEQFYVAWPLLVALLTARFWPRAVFRTALALAAASVLLMWRLYEPGGDTTRVYMGTDTRAAGLLLGAALAASGRCQPAAPPLGARASRWLDMGGVLALLALLGTWAVVRGQDPSLYRGGFLATELLCLVVVWACVRAPEGVLARTLSLRPLGYLGRISYGVYLFHWPINGLLTAERTQLGLWPLLGARLLATLLVASASFYAFERPIRLRGLPFRRGPLVALGALLANVGIVLLATQGAAGASTDRTPAALAQAPVPTPSREVPQDAGPPVPMHLLPPRGPHGPLRVLVLGDSVAMSLGRRMRYTQAPDQVFVAERGVGDCALTDDVAKTLSMGGLRHFRGDCSKTWQDDLRQTDPDLVLVVLAGAYFSKIQVDGQYRSPCHPGYGRIFGDKLRARLRSMQASGAKAVVMLAPYPTGRWQTPTRNAEVDCFNQAQREAAREGVAMVLDPLPTLCPGGVCQLTSEGAEIRPDGLHFDGVGADAFARWTHAALVQMAGPH
jgi:peptidoglycan/LPS O-acetylase OafA/YrhL